jgi:hypothetical protein
VKMFSNSHLQILLVIAMKSLVIISAQSDEDQTSLLQTEVDLVLDGIASKTADADIFLEDLDLPKNGSNYFTDKNNNNTTNNIRRWAPYPQNLPEVTSEKSLPSTSSFPWNSSPVGQPPTYQPQQMRSPTVNPWISSFWNSLPIVTVQPAPQTFQLSEASPSDVMMSTNNVKPESNAWPIPQTFDNARQPTSENSEQPKANQGPTFPQRQNLSPKSPRPAGPNPLEAFSPENGKTGIEMPILAAGLPNFRREEPMISTTKNPRVFPMTQFHDDNVPLDQADMSTFKPAQAPASPEFPSQDQMRSIDNVPQQKGMEYNYFPTRQHMPQLQMPFQQMQMPFQQMQVPQQQQQEQMPEKQQPSQSYLGPMGQQEQQLPLQPHSYPTEMPSASPEEIPSESIRMGQQLMDAHTAFGKAFEDFVLMCEEEKKVSVQMEKNFGPFYILTGAYPQDTAKGQLISAWTKN